MGRFAMFVADFLKWAIGPVAYQGFFDLARLLFNFAENTSNIGFLGLAFLKLKTEDAVGICIHRHNHNARCIHIKAVNNAGLRKLLLGALLNGIAVLLWTSGYR